MEKGTSSVRWEERCRAKNDTNPGDGDFVVYHTWHIASNEKKSLENDCNVFLPQGRKTSNHFAIKLCKRHWIGLRSESIWLSPSCALDDWFSSKSSVSMARSRQALESWKLCLERPHGFTVKRGTRSVALEKEIGSSFQIPSQCFGLTVFHL